MKLPENFKPTLERLVSQLHDLLPEEARPRGSIPTDTSSASSGTTLPNTFTLISEEQISNDEEIHRVQRFYNMAWLALNEVLPGIESIDSEDQLKEHLFQKKRPILQQWSHISLDRIRRDISKPNYAPTTTAQLIPQDHLIKIAGKEEEKVSELLQENAVNENATEKEVTEERTAKEKAAKEKAEQEEKDLHALFMQLSYNILHISAIEIPQQKVFKSPEELGWHSLNESQRIVDQLKLPLLNYLCRFLPNTDKPLTMGEMIPDERLSTDLEIQFFQRLYNIVCLLSNTIFPSLQGEGKCHSANDVISNLVSPILDTGIHGQVTPFLDRSVQYFIDELYKLLPTEGRPKTAGEIVSTQQIKANPFKGNNDLQVIVSIYNVACQIKNSILPRIKGIDSASISGLVKLFSEGFSLTNLGSFLSKAKKIANFLDEIKPLLKNLKPIFNQMRIFFINDLYTRLPDENKPSKCGELIADDKFSTTDSTSFFTQKCYNLACFILNEIIPGMEKCVTATGSLLFLFEDEQTKNFQKHFGFVNELMIFNSITLPIPSVQTTNSSKTTNASSGTVIPLSLTKDEGLALLSEINQPFLKQIEKFLKSIPNILDNLIFFFSFLVKETVKFTNLSITLNNTLSAPLVSGNLSYYAACHINEARETLWNLLSEGSYIEYKEGDPRLKERQNHLLIQSHLINLDQFMSTFFGFSKKTNAFDPGIEETLGEFGILSFKSEKTANFVAKEVKEIFPEYNELYNKNVSLNEKLTNFSAYLLTPQNCENTDVTEMFQDIQKQYHDFNQAIQVFSNHLDLLPKTKFIDFYVDSGGTINKQGHNYSDLAELVPYCKKSSEKFDEAIKNKIKILDQLKENNAYIKKAYENLSTSVINPAQDLLEKEKPTSYQFDYHQKINTLLLNLKKESFSEPKVDDLPHKEISKEAYGIKIDMFHRNFHTKRQTSITELEKELVNQKTHFNELLKNEVTQKLSDLSEETKVNTNILTDLFEKIGEDSGETNYRETLKSIEDWLATMTMDSLVSEILKTKSLENTELVNPWVSEFSGSDVGKEFVTQIKTLTTPLIQLIENQRVQLNATNQKEIKQLQGEINALATKITTYSESYPKVLEEIKVLQEKQQQEKQNLWEQHEKLNEIVQGLVQKVNAYTKTLNLSPISANTNVDLSSEIDGLFEALQKKLTSLAIDVPSLKSPPTSPSSKLSALSQLSPSSTSSITSSSSSSSASSASGTSSSTTTSSSFTFTAPNSPPPTSPTNRPKKSLKEVIEKLNDQAQTAKDFENILKILNRMKDSDVDKKSMKMLKQAIKQLAESEKNSDQSDQYMKEYALGFAKKLVVATTKLEASSAKEQSLMSDRETIKEKTQEACTVLGGILGDLTETISQQADATKKAIEDLNAQHTTSLEAAYQKLYGGIPKEKQPASPEAYLETLKKEQKMKQIQFALTQLKKGLNKNEAALKKIKKETDAITVPNVIFEQAGTFTFERWAAHHHDKKRQLNETKRQFTVRRKAFYKSQTEFKNLQEKINGLGEQIASLTSATSVPSIQVKALSSLKENIQKQGKILTEEYLEVKRARIKKVELFIKKRQALSAEKKQVQAFDEILVNVDQIRNQINAKIQVVNIRSHTSDYKNLVRQILAGTLKNPTCILQEDHFYQNISESIPKLQQLKTLATKKIQKATPLSVLETAFNQALDAKIKDAQTQISSLQTGCEKKKQEWETFSNSNQNLLLRHSREIANAPPDIREALTQCEDRFLDRIQLVDRNFQGVSIKNSRFRHAELIRCDFSGVALDRVDFSSADIQTCRFQNTNFKGVILDDKTQLDWKTHAQQILLDNIANPYNRLASDYLVNLIKLVKTKCQGEVSGDWILNLLKEIGQIKQPDNLKEKEHLIAQQNRAVFIVTELVPQLTLDEVLKLKALVENKHKGDENPYGFIRHELDAFRLKYGNTDPWKQIMTCVKGRLNEITQNVKLTQQQYKDGKRIMKTHVAHDYGFGFFYTPEIAHEWKVDHKPEEPKFNK